jgi:hypothetical protein
MSTFRLAPALIVSAVAACSVPTPERWTENGPVADGVACNPIAKEWDCMYPFPSDFFTKPDATKVTGRLVEMTPDALPKFVGSEDGNTPIDFFGQFPSDGFSVLPQVGVRIPGSVRAEDLIPMYGDVGASLTSASRTALIDAETGERVLHFSETDPRPEEVDDRILLVRPLIRLKSAHRYIVALSGLHTVAGSEIAPPATFGRVRDGDADGDTEERLAAYYDAHVFPALEKAGIARGGLQLAWDFTTESDEQTTGDMLSIRSQLIDQLAATPPVVTVTKVTNAPDTEHSRWIGREIKATIRVPLFLDSTEMGARIHRGADSKPAANGTAEFPFTIRIPNSVTSGARKGRIVQYGHGFYGTQREMIDRYPSRFADETGSVLVGADWIGVSTPDRGHLIDMLASSPEKTGDFTDRLHQAFANLIAISIALQGPVTQLSQVKNDAGELLYDPSRVEFYGLSMGGIVGKTYVALSPVIDRASFSVGGCGFGLLMSRAQPFGPLLTLVDYATGSRSGGMRAELLLQTALDRVDPITYAPHLLTNTYPGSPASRRILSQIGIGDTSVPNTTEHIFMRSVGVPVMTPGPRSIHGLETTAGPVEGSVLVEWDFGIPPVDVEAVPVGFSNIVHEQVRRQVPGNRMTEQLFSTGRVENLCGGVCRGVEMDDGRPD